ncbi:hypothetical protein [Shimazuella alba]|uniref:Uncharacterized protein n=1 Tax=Shimazuella alba TaxID=2690964 RepID=A0A6I4VT18_9BACL|nr:hypothetical protein [Shimazuella alba]MXQ53591.1 hypothetical protein [Shimazuella alba]
MGKPHKCEENEKVTIENLPREYIHNRYTGYSEDFKELKGNPAVLTFQIVLISVKSSSAPERRGEVRVSERHNGYKDHYVKPGETYTLKCGVKIIYKR